MGESTSMVHAILTITGIILASIFAAYVLGRMGYVNSVMSGVLNNKLQEIQTNIKIITGFYNQSESKYVIYVKNVGTLDIPESQLFNKTEIYVGNYDTYTNMYLLSNVTSPNTASLLDIDDDMVWETGETVVIKLPFSSQPTEPVRVKIVLPSGAYAEEVLPG